MATDWYYIDVAEMLTRPQEEATTIANVGAFERPMGPVVTRYPSPYETPELDDELSYIEAFFKNG